MDFFTYIVGCALFCWSIEVIAISIWRTIKDVFVSAIVSTLVSVTVFLYLRYLDTRRRAAWISEKIPRKRALLEGITDVDQPPQWDPECGLPPIVSLPQWDVVAVLPAFKNEAIKPVYVSDFDRFDDPIYPQKSILHCVGVRKRRSKFRGYYALITLWQVSTLTGRRVRLHTFYYCYRRFAAITTFGFESRSVVFVCLQDRDAHDEVQHSRLFVYDCRFSTADETKTMHPKGIRGLRTAWYPLAILCRGRLKKGDDLIGWRIQFLTIYQKQLYDEQQRVRKVFSNSIFDFDGAGGDRRMVSYEDVISRKARATALRLGRFVGFCRISHHRSWTLVFDTGLNRFLSFRDFDVFLRSDPVLRTYRDRFLSVRISLSPQLLSDRECTRVAKMNPETVDELALSRRSRVIIRATLQPPTLKMLAARAVFKIAPAVHDVKESEFTQTTGVDLKGHFE